MDYKISKDIDSIISKQKQWIEQQGVYYHSVVDNNNDIIDIHTHGLDKITPISINLGYTPHINFRYLNNNNYKYVLYILNYLISQVKAGDVFGYRHTFDYNNETFILFENIDENGELVLDIQKLDK